MVSAPFCFVNSTVRIKFGHTPLTKKRRPLYICEQLDLNLKFRPLLFQNGERTFRFVNSTVRIKNSGALLCLNGERPFRFVNGALRIKNSTAHVCLPCLHMFGCVSLKGCTTSLTTDWVAHTHTGIHVHVHTRIYNKCLSTYNYMYVCMYTFIQYICVRIHKYITQYV